MKTPDEVLSEFSEILQARFGDHIQDYLFPPPVFMSMKGELVALDLTTASLTARFPILERYRNPYGTMQGGMIAAAVDNTVGPLSVLVAPPSVTRTLEIKYSRPAVLEMEYIIVHGRLAERKDPQLFFEAKVNSPDGQKLATCKAVFWIIENKGQGSK